MKPDASHIKQIKVVSNTHWDREFRFSFEKTRRWLLVMLDTTIDLLQKDPRFPSFTMDGHAIMIDDYLEVRPEKRAEVEQLIQAGRLIIGPYYTLAEEFSISHEPLIRNLLFGRRTVEKYGGKVGTVAYTPSSWGQTGQLPQILNDFGLTKMMFYRGISHHEADAEYIWQAPDGTQVLASRFALFARYNWYYQVHRLVTRKRLLEADYRWGEFDDTPFKFVDPSAGKYDSFDLKAPQIYYDKDRLKSAIEEMVAREGPHFTTEVFLAMNGHDSSVPYPLESQIIQDAQAALGERYSIEHTDLEHYWAELEKHLDRSSLPVLVGERRSRLKQGLWTKLLAFTISARVYLKQQDFRVTNQLVYTAEPLASLAAAFGADYPASYLNLGWKYLLTNHTHDASAGAPPEPACQDIQYRYGKVADIASNVIEDSAGFIAAHLSPKDLPQDGIQLIVFNPLPFERDAVARLNLELPRGLEAQSIRLEHPHDPQVSCQYLSLQPKDSLVDSRWDKALYMDTGEMQLYAHFRQLPALGWRAYHLQTSKEPVRSFETLVTGPDTLENETLRVQVNPDGTVDIFHKPTGWQARRLNYLTDVGEGGDAWEHKQLPFDREYTSLGLPARLAVIESGPLSSAITAEYAFMLPRQVEPDGTRSQDLVPVAVKMQYQLERDADFLQVRASIDNQASDHWLRTNFPTGICTEVTSADSHFDVVQRPITLPDPTGWVEDPGGTHPLRTFVDVSDGRHGLAVFTQGNFEYEAFEDEKRSLAITLLRAIRVKFSKESTWERGIECIGMQVFDYAIYPHPGNWEAANLVNQAAGYAVPIRCAMAGRGKGQLPNEASLFCLKNLNLHVTCVKQAEDGHGLIIRLFNPTGQEQLVILEFGQNLTEAQACRMDESLLCDLKFHGRTLEIPLAKKKIGTYRVGF
jgi:hypothetical protein